MKIQAWNKILLQFDPIFKLIGMGEYLRIRGIVKDGNRYETNTHTFTEVGYRFPDKATIDYAVEAYGFLIKEDETLSGIEFAYRIVSVYATEDKRSEEILDAVSLGIQIVTKSNGKIGYTYDPDKVLIPE
jgi:hypothetical protein